MVYILHIHSQLLHGSCLCFSVRFSPHSLENEIILMSLTLIWMESQRLKYIPYLCRWWVFYIITIVYIKCCKKSTSTWTKTNNTERERDTQVLTSFRHAKSGILTALIYIQSSFHHWIWCTQLQKNGHSENENKQKTKIVESKSS